MTDLAKAYMTDEAPPCHEGFAHVWNSHATRDDPHNPMESCVHCYIDREPWGDGWEYRKRDGSPAPRPTLSIHVEGVSMETGAWLLTNADAMMKLYEAAREFRKYDRAIDQFAGDSDTWREQWATYLAAEQAFDAAIAALPEPPQ